MVSTEPPTALFPNVLLSSWDLTKTTPKSSSAILGNGSSISAVVNGKCVDTTMGLTPLEGVVMGTRSGNIDPAIMEFIAKKENLDIAGVMNVLNKKSGLYWAYPDGLSSDFRDLNEAAESGNEAAQNALEVLCYGIAKFVGGYVAAMNGVDAIIFTAGIGENAIPVREKVVSYLGYLGITLDKEANGHRGEERVISTRGFQGKSSSDPHQRGAGYLPRDRCTGKIILAAGKWI